MSKALTTPVIRIVGAAGLAVAILVAFGAFSPAQAQENLQDQIDALLAEIAQLQAQLGSSGGTVATGYTFNANLSQGDRGEAVKQLQIVLNANADTQVAASGAGSPGNETDYFGGLTRAAVVKFQNKHAADILAPVGLTSGTGYVGPSTRAKLNEMTSQPAPAPSNDEREYFSIDETISEDSQAESGGEVSFSPEGLDSELFTDLGDFDEFMLAFLSDNTVSPGDTVEITGYGFQGRSGDVRAKLGDREVPVEVRSRNTAMLSIPSSFPVGRYDLTLIDDNEEALGESLLIISVPGSAPPRVTHVSPETVGYGDTVTVHGEGFTSENNQIRTAYGLINGIPSSDGRTLEFRMEPFPDDFGDPSTFTGLEQEFVWEISIMVANQNGVSQDSMATVTFIAR